MSKGNKVTIVIEDAGDGFIVKHRIEDDSGRDIAPSTVSEFDVMDADDRFMMHLGVVASQSIENELESQREYNQQISDLCAEGYTEEQAVQKVVGELPNAGEYQAVNRETGERHLGGSDKPEILH